MSDLILMSRNVFLGDGCVAAEEAARSAAVPAALCVSGGRIEAVVPLDEAAAFKEQGTQVVDYGDAFVCAGLHDSHLHAFHSALYASPLADRFLGESEADCVERMKRLAARRPSGWLLAQGWREYRWNPPVLPSRHSLDAAFPDRPVALYSGDAHTLWLNSCALRELGIEKDSVPPEGGSYDRDETGELTGIVREAAAMELMPHIVGSFSGEEVAGAYRGFLARLASHGVTALCDMSLMAQPGMDFVRDDIWQLLLGAGDLTARVFLYPTLTDDLSRFETLHAALAGSPLLRVAGFKQFFDGVTSQHTAYVGDPYANARFSGDRGFTTVPVDRMRSLVMQAARAGHPVRIHTIGDEAAARALDIFEEAQEAYGRPTASDGGVGSHCLEHVEVIRPSDVERMARLSVVAAVQPPHITLDPGGPERDLGVERCRWMWPFATFMRNGVAMAFGTDSPVVDVDPLAGIYAAVTRRDPATHAPEGGWFPAECIGVPQALDAYARGSAQAAGALREVGTLECGKWADISVFDRDLTASQVTENPSLVLDTRCLATYVAGRCVYAL